MKTCVALCLSFVILLMTSPVYSQGQVGEIRSDQEVVARVFGQDISYMGEEGYAANALFLRIISPILTEYQEKNNITVTEQEIQEFIAGNKMAELDDKRKKILRLQKVKERLDSLEVSAHQKTVLEIEKLTLERMLDVPSVSRDERALFRIGKYVVQNWKMRVALFNEYGGRIARKKMGFEPIDAYKALLEKVAKTGEFVFYDKELEKHFWEYYRNDRMHVFIGDSQEAKKALMEPWWKNAAGIGE